MKTNVEPQLRPQGAFVIKLRSDAEVEAHRLSGRIDHHLSGDSASFASLETLLTFMAKHTGGGDFRGPQGETL